jgi:hypothetical protein
MPPAAGVIQVVNPLRDLGQRPENPFLFGFL